MYSIKCNKYFTALMTLPLYAAMPALAQTPGDGQASYTTLEEVIVTARKREQSLQDVGISVTAFSGDDIRDLRLTRSIEVAAQTPNLTINQSFGNSVPQVFIRGVGIKDPNANATTGVAIYVDDVNLVSPMALAFQLYDVERVEVLRGPQGTLYGRNTTGGAVKFISTKPTQELDAFARLSAGNYGAIEFEGAVSGPITDSLSARVSMTVNKDDGFHENRLTGNDELGDTDSKAARLLLAWEASEDVDVLLNFHGGKTDNSSMPFEHRGRLDAAGNSCNPNTSACVDAFGYGDHDGDPYKHDFDHEGETEFENIGGMLNINWRTSAFDVTSITAFENTERQHHEDADAGPLAIIDTYWDDDNKQFSQELRFSSPADAENTWIFGLFYSEEENDLSNQYDFFREFRPPFNPDEFIVLIDQNFSQEATSMAAFLHTEWALTEDWRLIAGLRYTDEERKMRQETSFREPEFSIPVVPEISDKTTFDNLSGKLGVDFQASEDWLFFASASTGFKSGGYNGALIFSPEELSPFDEETLTSFEVGFKSTLMDGRMRFNMTAFHYDYEDMQLFSFDSVGGVPVQRLTNAGEATIRGLEAELTVLPVENLQLNLGLGLLDTELDEYRSAVGDDLSGSALVMAPDVSFNGLVRYDIPLSNAGMLTLQTDFNYQDKVFFATSNDDFYSQDSYWIWNASASYALPDGRWRVTAWVKNIGDEEYLTETFDFTDFGYDLLIYGRPRTFGLEINYQM